MSDSGDAAAVRRVLPLYLVVFAGFVGYSLIIAISLRWSYGPTVACCRATRALPGAR